MKRVLWSAVASLSILVPPLTPAGAQAQWKPDGSVEMVVGAGAGGGQDRSVRAIQRVIQQNRLLDAPVVVVNKPGAASAIALAYLVQRQGNPHYLQLISITLLSNHILGGSRHTYTDVSPIATVFDEYVVTTVAAESPIRSGKDLIDRWKKNPGSVSIGVSGRGIGNDIAIAMVAKEAGVDARKLKLVVFKSGAEILSALLGGHVDAMTSTLSPVLGAMAAGKARIVGISAPRRLGGTAGDISTWREQGIDVEFSNWRSIVAAPGLTRAQIAYWESVFDKVVQADEFKADVQMNHAVVNYRRSEDTKKFLKAEYEVLKTILTELGMAK